MKNIKFNINEIKKVENGAKYKINLEFPIETGWITDVTFVVTKGNEKIYFPIKHQKNENDIVFFETEIELETRAIYHYNFSYKVNGEIKYIQNKDDASYDGTWKMSVNFETPDWAKGKIMYHIFVDRFNRGSKEALKDMPRRTIHTKWNEEQIIGPNEKGIWNADFYGGDLKGIEEKLDYIKSLGVSIIYLSPIVSSQSNHRYDASDYEMVDPYAGTNEDLKKLCQQAHKKGIKIVLDAVFNHTGNDSKYFNEYGTFNTLGAYQSIYSTYAPFYKKYYDNGKIKYSYWWGMTNLPVCDGNSSEWQNYIYGEGGIIDKWFELGIDGLRLDVADELTDEFIENIRKAVKRNKEDGFILGEVWKNPMRMNRSYIESGKGMDSVMDYSLIDALIRYFKYEDTYKIKYIINDILNEYPKDTINTLMNFTSTHDISRAIDIFSSSEFKKYGEWAWDTNRTDLEWYKNFKLSLEQYNQGKEIYEAYAFALTFLPGILSIFYGDEIGIEGIGNLSNRKAFTWDKADLELLKFFRYMGTIRKNEPFLEEADLKIIDINNKYMMFEREKQTEKVLITVNRTNEEHKFCIPKEYENYQKFYTLKRTMPRYLSPYGGIAIKK